MLRKKKYRVFHTPEAIIFKKMCLLIYNEQEKERIMLDYRTSTAYEVFRGINEARTYSWETPTQDNQIPQAASVFSEDNKTNLTIALEDFSEKFKSFHGSNHSNISANDAKKKGIAAFFENIGWKKPSYKNLYETPIMQGVLKENNVFQSDIFNQSKAYDGGIRYANEGEDIYESALNFAQADIGAIEKSYSIANAESKTNGKLEFGEIKSYINSDSLYKSIMEDLDLDGNTNNITAEEYAAFLIAADGAYETDTPLGIGYDPSSIDGLITDTEAQVAKNFTEADFKEYAQKIYNEHYKDKK